jgi:hypothetical protein
MGGTHFVQGGLVEFEHVRVHVDALCFKHKLFRDLVGLLLLILVVLFIVLLLLRTRSRTSASAQVLRRARYRIDSLLCTVDRGVELDARHVGAD